jgi:hypothetical protein
VRRCRWVLGTGIAAVQRQWQRSAGTAGRRDVSVAMQLASGPQARWQARGCDRQLTKAWMEHLGVGCGRNFTGGQRGEEQRKGMGLGR